MSPDIDAIAHRLAYHAAVSDIEMCCAGHADPRGGKPWYDLLELLDPDPSNLAAVTDARGYLELCGLLDHHPYRSGWVRFRPRRAAAPEAPLDLGPWPIGTLGITLVPAQETTA